MQRTERFEPNLQILHLERSVPKKEEGIHQIITRNKEEEMSHINIESKTEYKGKNIEKLDSVYQKEGYEHKVWGTFRQWNSRGHSIGKGQKGVKLTFFSKSPEEIKGNEESSKFIRHFTVFNLEQTTPQRILEKIQKGKK